MQQQQHHHQQQLQHVQQFLASSSLRNKLWDDHPPLEEQKLPQAPSPAPSPTIPPPAHQNSSPRLANNLGSLDLRVKSTLPPAPFTPLPPPKAKPPVETPSAGASPGSPIDLSASSAGTGSAGQVAAYAGAGQQGAKPAHSKPKEKRGKGGSRIDALALNLQARKQQQLMQEQHHPLADIGSMLERTTDKGGKNHDDMEESLAPPSMSRHHSHHHHDRRMEEEESKLRKKRLQYSEDSVRKALNRGFDMSPAPAHSSFMNPNMSSGSSRLNLGSNKNDDHPSNNPMLDPSALMHHDFKKWIDEHPELVAANPNLVAAAAAAMAFSPVQSFPSHTELLELPEGRRRGRRPRLDPTKLDYDKITGEENVSVINRLTGKKGNLPNNMSKRIVTPSEKRGRRTAASLLASAHQNLVPPATTTMSFPTGLNPLSFANTGMLGGFPNMKFFMDPPKSSATSSTSTASTTSSTANPPIFLPFGGLAGMGLTNPLFGFPGFNFPGSSPLGSTNLPSKDHKEGSSDKGRGEKDSRKSLPASSVATSGSTTLPSSSLPFLYPPGLLYNPLSLGGFTLPPNLPASFGSFSQSGLVNGLGLTNPLFTTSSLGTSLSSSAAMTITTPATTHGIISSAPAVAKTTPSVATRTASPGKLPPQGGHFSEGGQETDDESLKSLMGNHEDDDMDMMEDEGKAFDNPPDKDDSDKEGFRDPANNNSLSAQPAKTPQSDNNETSVSLAKTTNSETPSLESTGKSRGMHDDPTSDSTDTESKHS